MRNSSIVFFLFYWISSFVFSQEKYDNCSAAITICPNDTITVNNYAATSTKCTNCEDDISAFSCFQPKNSIWLTFTTNALGGAVQVNVRDISYKTNPNQASVLHAALFKAVLPCDPTTYTLLGSCVLNGTSDLTISEVNLPANTTYFIVLSGGLTAGYSIPAEAQMRIHISGTGVVRDKPEISIFSPKQTLCKNETIRLDCQLVHCADSTKYSWYINDTLVAKTDSAFYETNRLKEGDVVHVSNSCFTRCSVEITAKSSPFKVIDFVVDAGKDTTIHEGESVVLQGLTQGTSFYWNSMLGKLTDLNSEVSPAVTTTYTLISSYQGCTLYDEVRVKVLQTNLEAVTSFSPNGDGINDTWLIPSLEDYPNCEVKIYSRWGQPVFETTGYSFKKSWDGTYNGNVVDEGVYFYIIHLRDSKHNAPIQGTVTVVR
jgi:gliding motility-associated-like protein